MKKNTSFFISPWVLVALTGGFWSQTGANAQERVSQSTDAVTATATLKAFPEAQGWGRFATGGRKGSVYHVTNLNDSGSGSFRDAVSQSNRIVVFDVAGVINISSRIVFSSNLYVAGQTAPGEGVTIYGNGVSFSGASNSIFRHLRIRMGKNGSSGKDCAGIANGTNMIFDHCSFSWGLDETFSINPATGATLHSITLQNCIFGQGLLLHSAGGLMQADSLTLYRNFYCDNSTRNNKVKGIHQYVNNVVYNWSSGCYIMGGDSEGSSYANTTGNLFINGPSGGGNACTGGNADFHIYAADNWQDKNKNGVFDPYEIPQSEYSGGPTFMPTPYNYPELETVDAKSLIETSLPTVGASLPYRDYVDYYMVDQCRSYGKQGSLLSTETVLPFGVPSSWTVWKGNTRIDSDKDGMPDDWETANGTDPNKDDAMTKAANGYTNIENYINSITQDEVDFYLRQPMLIEASASTQSTITLSWADYTEGEEGFIIEMQNGTTWTELGRTSGTTFTATNLAQPATAYTFRVCAYFANLKSEYTTLTAKTQPEQIDMIDVDSYIGETEEIENDLEVLIDTDTDLTKTLSAAITPKNVVVKGVGHVTIEGTGSIAGSGSVNKAGIGVLSLSTSNDYTGATVLHEGTIEFASLGNGGVKSSIGASSEFAQYWVWDGGTWSYTGGTTATNRSANLLQNSRFAIANSASTVTMNGTLQGNGGLTLAGKGTMVPATKDFFSYDGETRLEGGTLSLKVVSLLWTDKLCNLNGNKLVMAGGTLKTTDNKETYSTYTFPIEVVEGTTSVLDLGSWNYLKSAVSGSGTLNYKVNYLREYITGNWDDFTGRVIAEGTTGTSGQQQFLLDNGRGIKNGVVELKGTNTQIVCWSASQTYYLGGLAGSAGTYLSGFSKQTDSSKGTWIVGGAGTDETFSGVIDNRCSASGHNGTVSIVKEGEGQWRLNGNNVYSGTTQVTGGTLTVNGKHSGTGAYTVTDEAILNGTGSIAGAVTVQNGGTIQAGDGVLVNKNTLSVGGKLTLNAGSRVVIPVGYVSQLGSAAETETVSAYALWANDKALSNELEAEVSEDGVFESTDYSYDNTVSVADTLGYYSVGDGAYPDTRVTWYKSTAATFSVSYSLTAQQEFTPTGLAAFMLRAGTDGTLLTVTCQIDNGAAKTIASNLVPKRNNTTTEQETAKGITPTAQFNGAISGLVVPAGSTLTVTFTTTCTAGRSFGLANVKISGTYAKLLAPADPTKYTYTAKANRLVISSASVADATLVLDMAEVKTDLQNGATFQLFAPSSATAMSGSFATIEPAVPAEGMQWDVTELYSKGLIKAVSATPDGIEAIENDGMGRVEAPRYNLNGQRIDSTTKGLIFEHGKKIMNR